MSRRILTFVFAAFAISAWIGAANGALINVQFGSNSYSGAAVIGAGGDDWNLITTHTGTASLTDVTGAATGVTMDSSSAGIGTLIGHGGPFDPPNQYANLFGGQATAFTSGTQINIVLENLAPGPYDLYLISACNFPGGPQSRSLAVTANGVGPVTIGPNNGATTIQVNTNYRVLHPIVGLDGMLTIIGSGASADEGNLNGFQLQSVPEPGALMLLISGVLGLVRLRRRYAIGN